MLSLSTIPPSTSELQMGERSSNRLSEVSFIHYINLKSHQPNHDIVLQYSQKN
jgi:hypothetical protein